MSASDWLISVTKSLKSAGLIDTALRYNPLYRSSAMRAIAHFTGAGPADRRRLSEQFLQRTLKRAATSAYGRQFGTDYDNWPVLEKHILRDTPESLYTGSPFRIPAETSGTTGLPVRLIRSLGSIAAEQAFLDHLLAPAGFSLRTARTAILRATDVKHPDDRDPPYGAISHGGKRLALSCPHLTPATFSWYFDALDAYRPDILWVRPTSLAALIKLMREAGRSLQIPIVLSSSEMLPANTFEAAEQTLSATVIDYYGTAERVNLASAVHPGEYWFHPAYGYTELVPTPEAGSDRARIIATGYWNTAMPLVRYDTGDQALIPPNSSAADLRAIALGIKPFAGIAGRTNEYVISPAGMQLGGLNQLPRYVPHVLQLQIIQESLHRVVIKVLAEPAFGEDERARILANARTKIPPEIDVSIEVVSELETTAGGKAPFVIRKI